jgi:hypothetical protein
LAGSVVAYLALGCGKSDELDKLLPVKGKIIFSGKPITTGNARSVKLVADRSQGNTTDHEPHGAIDADGNFEIFTANRPGAPPGRYKVAVSIMESPMNTRDMYAPPKWLIDRKYGDPETSGLSVTVVEKPEADAYDLRITSTP